MIDIKSMNVPELEGLLAHWGQPKFRAKQIFSWLHDKRVLTFGEMTNLPAALREKLETECETYGACRRLYACSVLHSLCR